MFVKFKYMKPVLFMISIASIMILYACYFLPSPCCFETKRLSNDTLTLSKVIHSECSICPISEQLLIGSVVLNRVLDGRWGSTIDSVVYYPNQFYQASGGENWESTDKSYQIARFLMVYGTIDASPLYFFKTFDKSFTHKLKITVREKHHIFAKD